MKITRFLALFLFLTIFLFPINAFAETLIDDEPFYLTKKATGEGVKVAVIDSGIAPHDDLNIVGGYNFIDFTKPYTDGYNHGTMVAGVLAGKTYGVAPDVELYALKVLRDDGNGSVAHVIDAVNWSIENDMDIINMSLIISSDILALENAIKKAIAHNILVVVCAGNNGGIVTHPANVEGVFSIGALNDDWTTRADFSAYIGRVDYWAKGTNIYNTNRFNSYNGNAQGTSFSAPYVAGIGALYKEAFPNATIDELKQMILENSKDIAGQENMKIPQEPQYEERYYINFKSVNGKFEAERKLRYYPISSIKNANVDSF